MKDNSKKIKICIVGIGAVGGFYGGLLAKEYQGSNDIEIYFLSRGQNMQAINNNGICVQYATKTIVAKPYMVSDNSSQIGTCDYVIVATKTYDLSNVISQISPLISDKTIILPLLNGIQSYNVLKQAFPKAIVIQGCTYIISRLCGPGLVKNPSGKELIYFGLQQKTEPRLEQLSTIFDKAGISNTLTTDINTQIWKKYLLVSSSAVATSYFNADFNQIVAKYPNEIKQLLDEALGVALALKIDMPVDIVQTIIQGFRNNPSGSTTSMHSDFLANKSVNELETMAGYIVKKAKELGVEVPLYNKMYKHLLEVSELNYRPKDSL